MGSLNINSLCKHIDELRALMVGEPLDILAINETKLESEHCDGCSIYQGTLLFIEIEISLVEEFVFIYDIL